jgi:hypothetical protein
MDLRRITPVCFFILFLGRLTAQDFSGVAEQYVRWAEEVIAGDRWNEALTGLERSADYADVSSDLSYLLALARSRTGKPRGAVLEALRRAGEAQRWNRYSPDQALLLEAETFIALRNFSAALMSLARIPANADSAVLRLRALRGLPDINEFRRFLGETLDRYPRDPRPALIFLEYAKGKTPEGTDQPLMDRVLGRLPYLLEAEPRLAWMAAPFIQDKTEARRLLEAYRGRYNPLPASIPETLRLGLIHEEDAVGEFFAGVSAVSSLDWDLGLEIFSLLRDEVSQGLFRECLFRFSGFITADGDHDGFPEGRARYREGVLVEYFWDADQVGLAELRDFFDPGGNPQWAEQVVLPEAADQTARPADGEAVPGGSVFAIPVRDEERIKTLIFWEQYPGVLRAELEGLTYIPPPGEFLFSPIRFTALAGNAVGPGLLYPFFEPLNIRISRRTLVSFSVSIRRPSLEFEGAVEWIDLRQGIPQRAAEVLNGRPVSVTEFSQGKARVQYVDLDLDNRMETIRRFRAPDAGSEDENLPDYKKIIEFSESDWDGDGTFETGEQYLFDGTVVYSWDMDGDGIREYSEVKVTQ